MLRAFTPFVKFLAAACVSASDAQLNAQLNSLFPRAATTFVSLGSGGIGSSGGFGAVSRVFNSNSKGSGSTFLSTLRARLERHHTARAQAGRPVFINKAPMSSSAQSGTVDGGSIVDAVSDNLPYRYRWPRPAVTVDCLIYALDEGKPWILLIKRKNDPCKGSWALPGGFVDQNEGLDVAARRELEEETGVTNCTMVQTGAYGDPGRDPRGHTITVAFMAWAPSRASCNARAGDDAAEAAFFPVERLPNMAFDHLKVITDSWARCQFKDDSVNDGRSEGGLSVEDRASGQTLVEYPSSSAAELNADALGLLQPAEASP